MACEICGEPTKKKINRFCSVKCKGMAAPKRERLDPTINIKCKIDGTIFPDYSNRSGTLTVHSRKVLNKEFDWNDWERIQVELKPTWNCPHCDWTSTDLTNQSGCITIHLENKHNLTPEQHCDQHPNDKELWKMVWIRDERNQKLNESEENRIQCLECGEFMVSISNSHLKHKHRMTKNEYREKYKVQILSSQEYRKRLSIQYHNNDGLQNSSVWRSKYEVEICSFLSELGIEVDPNNKKKFGFDVDVFLPEYNLAIEFNGLYYHSQYAGGKTEFYHLNKTKECEKLGIHLIHIFEDEWVNKREIVVSRIKNQLGKTEKILYARKCEIKEIDYQTSSKFIEENHIQGSITNAKVHLALIHDNEIVSVMTFGGMRNSTGNKIKIENEWELQRFCNKVNCSVVGGASRLLNYFEKKFKISKLTTFADRRWTSNLKDSLYDELGFTLTSLGSPNYWYLILPMTRSSRFSYKIQDILKKFPDADPDLSEWENMIELGFDRIYDCGSLKYEKVYDNSKLEIDLSEKIEMSELRQVKRRRKKKETTRNIIDVECKICFNSYSIVGIHNHFKLNHGLTVEDYVEKYEEYRPENLRQIKVLNEVGDRFQCKICNECLRNEKHLTVHLNSQHSIEKLDYVLKYIVYGKIPTCKCGCGQEISLIPQFPYFRDFISGHNVNGMTGRSHSEETHDKMKEKAVGRFGKQWHIDRYGEVDGLKRYELRNSNLSNRRTSSQNPAYQHIEKDDLINYIIENPECRLCDVTEHFKVGSTCIYRKLETFFNCKNLTQTKEFLNKC